MHFPALRLASLLAAVALLRPALASPLRARQASSDCDEPSSSLSASSSAYYSPSATPSSTPTASAGPTSSAPSSAAPSATDSASPSSAPSDTDSAPASSSWSSTAPASATSVAPTVSASSPPSSGTDSSSPSASSSGTDSSSAPTSTSTSTSASGGQCNVGTVQCCNSAGPAYSAYARGVLGLLGFVLEDVVGLDPDALAGYGCSAGGASCTAMPMCCENNTFQGLINLGCIPISIVL